MSLFAKSVKGFLWSAINSIGVQVVNLIVQIILARILLPEDFGMMALLQVFLVVGLFLMEGGMGSSLIRLKDPQIIDYNTVFYSSIVFSVLLYLLFYVSAPFVAEFYNEERLISLIRVLSLSFVIRSCAGVQVAILIKSMDFRKQVIIQIPSLVISGVIGIVLAYYGYGIWSLIYFNVIQSLLYCILYWLVVRWIPTFVFDLEVFKYHFNFGYKIAMTNVFNGIFDNIYNMIIGKVYNVTSLSYYNRAETFHLLPGRVLSSALENVTYPLFSELQDDNVKLQKTYRSIFLQVFYIHSPLMIGLVIIAIPFFRLLLTEKWIGLVPYFQILLLAGLFNPLQRYNLNILRVKNKPSLVFYLNVIKKVVLVVGIVLTIKMGLIYMVISQSIMTFVSFLIIVFYVGKYIDYNIKQCLVDLFPLILLNLFWAFCLFCFFKMINYFNYNDLCQVAFSFSFGLLLYWILSHLFKVKEYQELKGVVLKFNKSRK